MASPVRRRTVWAVLVDVPPLRCVLLATALLPFLTAGRPDRATRTRAYQDGSPGNAEPSSGSGPGRVVLRWVPRSGRRATVRVTTVQSSSVRPPPAEREPRIDGQAPARAAPGRPCGVGNLRLLGISVPIRGRDCRTMPAPTRHVLPAAAMSSMWWPEGAAMPAEARVGGVRSGGTRAALGEVRRSAPRVQPSTRRPTHRSHRTNCPVGSCAKGCRGRSHAIEMHTGRTAPRVGPGALERRTSPGARSGPRRRAVETRQKLGFILSRTPTMRPARRMRSSRARLSCTI